MRFVVVLYLLQAEYGGSGNMIPLMHYSFSTRIGTCTLVYSSPIVFLNKLPILQIVQCNLSFVSLQYYW